ncbi:MAG: glutathione S-transferase N-terminal domain-containing protein [Bacteroidales bacterium]|nr:glutathione S-transferase N-terminal domain-containing protein [Bacteroidales bacterium]
MQTIHSHQELLDLIQSEKKAYCLLFKKGSEISDCAFRSISEGLIDNVVIATADVNEVRDIHEKYGITSVPTLMIFENGLYQNMDKGCNDVAYYRSLFAENIFSASNDAEAKPQKRVTVYSTPTCTYCNQIKKYFNEKGIKYRDVDVSKDQKAAEAMVKRSGQQGVPQTDINGQIVIGFDRIKINQLLGIE